MKAHDLYIGSDHHGYTLKCAIIDYLGKLGYHVHDKGTDGLGEVDYPIFAAAVAEAVSKNPSHVKGILLCGTGVGVSVVANKFEHVRAGLVFDEETAYRSRNDDDCNVLCLAADYLNENEAIHIVDSFLSTPFSDNQKYHTRLTEIAQIELKEYK